MWQDLMKKAISATASSSVLANKYKQMKNKIQQTQVATSGATTTTSPAKQPTNNIPLVPRQVQHPLLNISHEASWNECNSKPK